MLSASCFNYSKNPPKYTLDIEVKPAEASRNFGNREVEIAHIYKRGMSSGQHFFKGGVISEAYTCDIDVPNGISVSVADKAKYLFIIEPNMREIDQWSEWMSPFQYDDSSYAIETSIMRGRTVRTLPLVNDSYRLRYRITVDHDSSFMAVIDHQNYWVSRRTVSEGETVRSIANRHQISESLLRKVNGISKHEDFTPGQNIKVPILLPDGDY